MHTTSLATALRDLVERRDLGEEAMRGVIGNLIAGRFSDGQSAALLVALRMKGETATELAAAATVLREHMVRLETGRSDRRQEDQERAGRRWRGGVCTLEHRAGAVGWKRLTAITRQLP